MQDINKANRRIALFVINRLRENKSWLQTKTEVNTSTIRGKQLNNRNFEVQQKTKTTMQHTEKRTIR